MEEPDFHFWLASSNKEDKEQSYLKRVDKVIVEVYYEFGLIKAYGYVGVLSVSTKN